MTNSTANTSAIATASDSAIEVTATALAPINQDAQNAVANFTARPAVAAGISALTATGDGVKLMWEYEQESHTVRNFFGFLFDAGKAIFGPLFAVLWLAINRGYVWVRKPETRALADKKWKALCTWLAPKYDYEQSELRK